MQWEAIKTPALATWNDRGGGHLTHRSREESLSCWTRAALVMLFGSSILACNRSETVTAPQQSQPGPTRSVAMVPRAHADEPLRVVIEPASPTVETDLTAVANDTAVTYSWMVNGHLIDASGRTLSKDLFRRADTVVVEVELDGQLARAETTVLNSAPRALEVGLDRPLDSVHQGLDVRAVPKGLDPDGDDIRWEYQWIVNDEPVRGQTTEVLPGDRYQRGDRVTVQVIPSDGEMRGEPYTPLAFTVPNGVPEFVSRPPAHAGGPEYVYQAQTADPEGDQVRYRLVSAPQGMTIDARTGVLRWPLVGVAAGRQSVEIEISDDKGGTASQTFELDIAPPEGS